MKERSLVLDSEPRLGEMITISDFSRYICCNLMGIFSSICFDSVNEIIGSPFLYYEPFVVS